MWIRIRIPKMDLDPDPGSSWIRIQYASGLGSGSTTLLPYLQLRFLRYCFNYARVLYQYPSNSIKGNCIPVFSFPFSSKGYTVHILEARCKRFYTCCRIWSLQRHITTWTVPYLSCYSTYCIVPAKEYLLVKVKVKVKVFILLHIVQ